MAGGAAGPAIAEHWLPRGTDNAMPISFIVNVSPALLADTAALSSSMQAWISEDPTVLSYRLSYEDYSPKSFCRAGFLPPEHGRRLGLGNSPFCVRWQLSAGLQAVSEFRLTLEFPDDGRAFSYALAPNARSFVFPPEVSFWRPDGTVICSNRVFRIELQAISGGEATPIDSIAMNLECGDPASR